MPDHARYPRAGYPAGAAKTRMARSQILRRMQQLAEITRATAPNPLFLLERVFLQHWAGLCVFCQKPLAHPAAPH
jgi:hypothetical protein